MLFRIGLVFGLMIGAVSGVTVIAIAISSGAKDWFTPDVIGPTIGALLAAMVGLGGAWWGHYREDLREQKNIKNTLNPIIGAVFNSAFIFKLCIGEMQKAIEEEREPDMLLEAFSLKLKKSLSVIANHSSHYYIPGSASYLLDEYSTLLSIFVEQTDSPSDQENSGNIQEVDPQAMLQLVSLLEKCTSLGNAAIKNIINEYPFLGWPKNGIDDLVNQTAADLHAEFQADPDFAEFNEAYKRAFKNT